MSIMTNAQTSFSRMDDDDDEDVVFTTSRSGAGGRRGNKEVLRQYHPKVQRSAGGVMVGGAGEKPVGGDESVMQSRLQSAKTPIGTAGKSMADKVYNRLQPAGRFSEGTDVGSSQPLSSGVEEELSSLYDGEAGITAYMPAEGIETVEGGHQPGC